MQSVFGMPVIICGATKIRRSWYSRLFTLPWRPFRKYDIGESFVKDGEVIKIGGSLHMNPRTWDTMKRQISEERGRLNES